MRLPLSTKEGWQEKRSLAASCKTRRIKLDRDGRAIFCRESGPFGSPPKSFRKFLFVLQRFSDLCFGAGALAAQRYRFLNSSISKHRNLPPIPGSRQSISPRLARLHALVSHSQMTNTATLWTKR